MTVRENVALASHTSLSVGGPARFFIEAENESDVRAAAALAAAQHLPLLPLGGGTNILVPDAGVDAVVLAPRSEHLVLTPNEDGTVLLVASAGASWDALVDAAASANLWGIENLAGIPGRAAGALVQNIGAYGAELSDVFVYADVFNLATGVIRRIDRKDAGLSYRSSIFKGNLSAQAGRNLVILRIALSLARSGTPRLAYADLARRKEEGAALSSPGDVAEVVRSIRATKFPTAGEGTAGSFFKNPIISKEQAERLIARFPGLPSYSELDGRMKLSLAWLLDHVLGLKGYAQGPVRLFERQPIVLVALPSASAADIDMFARSIERRVHDAFGIVIEREVETFGARVAP